MTRKTRQDGIRTLADLHKRCKLQPETGCLIWQGARKNSGARVYAADLQQAMSMNAALPFLVFGERQQAGAIWMPMCGHTGCATWEHRRRGTRGELMAMLRPQLTREHKEKQARTKRDKSNTYSRQAHADIMMSDEKLAVLAQRWGMCQATISKIKKRKLWADAEWRTVRLMPPDQRYTASALPDGHVGVSASECRPWAKIVTAQAAQRSS